MRAMLERYAAEYAAAEQRQSGRGDDQSSIHYPTVFLFIGDLAAEAIEPMILAHRQRWDNSEGVVYLHVGVSGLQGAAGSIREEHSRADTGGAEERSVLVRRTGSDSPAEAQAGGSAPGSRAPAAAYSAAEPKITETAAQAANVGRQQEAALIRVQLARLAPALEDSRSMRRELGRLFHEERSCLAELNRAFRRVGDIIADYGRMYVSFDRLHLAVITRADDSLNVLVPDIALLAESILMQSFKSVQKDLYVLLNEREQSDHYAMAGAVGVSFLREVEAMQQSDYTYTAQLRVTGDGLSIPVSHPPSPLFDLVYMLSDRNEKGVAAWNGMETNYAIISHIMLLKNRQRKEAAEAMQGAVYNNAAFRSSLLGDSGRYGLVSAGLAVVNRPNEAIALTVLYHFTRQLMQRLKQVHEPEPRERLAFFAVDPLSLSELLGRLLPPREQVGDMNALLTRSGVKYEHIRRMTLREAEQELFGDSCERFFETHFRAAARERLTMLQPQELLRGALARQLAQWPQISFVQLAAWTDEQGGADSVLHMLHTRMRDMAREQEQLRDEWEQYKYTQVEELRFQRLPMMDKHNLRAFLRQFFEQVYQRAWSLLELETELAVCRMLAGAIEELHEQYQAQVRELEWLADTFHEAALAAIERTDRYTGQNIFEYYDRVTAEVMLELENRRGAGIWFDDRYVGSISRQLEEGASKLAQRLMIICRKEVLGASPFSRTFEEELLDRANVSIEYSNRQALSKEELFSRLMRTLDEQAAINIRLLDYTHEHRYEEQYLFGDGRSEFVRYALKEGEGSLVHRLGCVHERRTSGVDKLSLMGGFHVEDLMFYRNSRVYYETYAQKGCQLHYMEQDKLPQLR